MDIPSACDVGVVTYRLTTVYVPSVLLIMVVVTLPGRLVCHEIRDGGLPFDDLHVATVCSTPFAIASVLASAEFCGSAARWKKMYALRTVKIIYKNLEGKKTGLLCSKHPAFFL